jgi:uncharacterized protein with GYD domain
MCGAELRGYVGTIISDRLQKTFCFYLGKSTKISIDVRWHLHLPYFARVRKDYIPSVPDSIRVKTLSEFVVLSRLTAEGRKTLKSKPERLKEVNKEIEKMGAKVLKQYALLGKYDFLTILEAPDNETVAKVMVELGSRGSLDTTTLAAMNIDAFLKSLK